ACEHGAELPEPDAVAYALGEAGIDQPADVPAPSPGWAPLTRRQRQVAELVARGLSDKEIAVTLFTSRRTAESHVAHILQKLGFAARTQIATWVAERSPD
ncbi:MAG TPA: helix-turn-helix transcriptional regulator, partial [Rugosimonospora sp.]|nr:helix-turn-helix transcriptional regulator [Rugosimonospora sp.]